MGVARCGKYRKYVWLLLHFIVTNKFTTSSNLEFDSEGRPIRIESNCDSLIHPPIGSVHLARSNEI